MSREVYGDNRDVYAYQRFADESTRDRALEGRMAYYPWDMLREIEILALANRENPIPAVIDRLRELVEACSQAPEADEAILYHGALAILHEFDGKIQDAVRARETEIRKIERLLEALAGSPSDVQEIILDNYSEHDLAVRREILAELRNKC